MGARVPAALDAKGEDARGAPAHVFPYQRVVLVIRQAGVVHPGHLLVALEELGDLERVLANAFDAQRHRLDSLQDQEGVEGADRRAHVAQRHDTGATDERCRSQRLGVDHAVVGDVGFVKALEFLLVFGPGELA
jgi:hypothetical protein